MGDNFFAVMVLVLKIMGLSLRQLAVDHCFRNFSLSLSYPLEHVAHRNHQVP